MPPSAFASLLALRSLLRYVGSGCMIPLTHTHDTKFAGQFGGAADAITQAHLQCSTLAQAWKENRTISSLTEFEKLPLKNWKPSVPGGAPSFHDTSAQLQDSGSLEFIDRSLSVNPTPIIRSAVKTQLYPIQDLVLKRLAYIPTLSGILTSFSALR